MKQAFIVIFILLIAKIHASSQATVPLWKTLPDAPAMPKADKTGFAPVNDIKIYYAVFNNQDKETVILLHGGFASSDEWGFEVPLLSKTRRVIIIDSRGHGRSSMSNQELGYSLMASDVLKVMDYLDIKKACVVGWSDGGIIGLIMAIKYPERISKLFTFGANYNLTGYKNEPPDSALAARYMARVEANYRKLSPTPDGFARLAEGLGKMYSSEPDIKPAELKTIKAPTVVACGQYEQFIKLEHFQDLANLIPNAKLVVLPNVSHAGPLQDPARFHAAIMNWINNK